MRKKRGGGKFPLGSKKGGYLRDSLSNPIRESTTKSQPLFDEKRAVGKACGLWLPPLILGRGRKKRERRCRAKVAKKGRQRYKHLFMRGGPPKKEEKKQTATKENKRGASEYIHQIGKRSKGQVQGRRKGLSKKKAQQSPKEEKKG